MAAALEGIADGAVLLAILLTIVLFGTVLALRSIVGLVTNAIRSLSVAGVHFGAPLANAIDGVMDDIVHWIAHWLDVEIHFFAVMLRGTMWTIVETVNAVVDAYNAVADFAAHVVHHTIPDAIHALRRHVEGLIDAVSERVTSLVHHVGREIGRIDDAITSIIHLIPHAIASAVHAFNVEIVQPIVHRVGAIERRIEDAIVPRIHAVEQWTAHVGDEIAAAVATVEDVIPRLPHIGFDDLEEMINRVPWRRLAGLLSIGFLTHALLRALTREAGLDRAECRGKVRGVCGTHNDAWENLLAGLAGGLIMLDFPDVVNVARQVMDEVKDDFLDFAGHGR